MMELIDIVTILEFVFAGLGVLYFLIMLAVMAFVMEEVEADPELKTSSIVTVILTIILLIAGVLIILNVVLAFVLHRGVKNRDLDKINKWFTAQCVIMGIGLVGTFGKMFSDPSIILKNGIILGYRGWTLYVVKNFVKKLKEEGPQDFGAPANFQPMAQE